MPCYEPELNRTYADLARHYGLAVIPARAAKPRDKAKVEWGPSGGTLAAGPPAAPPSSHWPRSTRPPTPLPALNARPLQEVAWLTSGAVCLPRSPRTAAPPPQPYEYAEWKLARVNIDYHVEVEGHYYSVPYTLVRQQLDIRLRCLGGGNLHQGETRCQPPALSQKGRHSTVAAHMPRAHQHYAAWTPQRLIHWAATSGPATAQVVERILASRPHPQQGSGPV